MASTSRIATFQVHFPFEQRVLYECHEELCAHEKLHPENWKKCFSDQGRRLKFSFVFS